MVASTCRWRNDHSPNNYCPYYWARWRSHTSTALRRVNSSTSQTGAKISVSGHVVVVPQGKGSPAGRPTTCKHSCSELDGATVSMCTYSVQLHRRIIITCVSVCVRVCYQPLKPASIYAHRSSTTDVRTHQSNWVASGHALRPTAFTHSGIRHLLRRISKIRRQYNHRSVGPGNFLSKAAFSWPKMHKIDRLPLLITFGSIGCPEFHSRPHQASLQHSPNSQLTIKGATLAQAVRRGKGDRTRSDDRDWGLSEGGMRDASTQPK